MQAKRRIDGANGNLVSYLIPVIGLCLTGWLTQAAEPVLEFDGGSAEEAVELTATVTLDGDFTIEYWFKTQRAGSWRLINNAADYDYSFGFRGSDEIAFWSPDIDIDLSESFVTETWEHLAVTRTADTVRIYRNGNEIGSDDWNGEIRLDRIGGTPGNSGWNAYDGRVAEVRVWDHARSEAMIQLLMDYRLAGNEEGLLGYWPMNEDSGDEVFDVSGQDNTGTVNNASWVVDEDLTLLIPDVDFMSALPFTLADIETGSEHFTNSNEVDVVDFPVPDGYDQFQFTENGDVGSLGAWEATHNFTGRTDFSLPGADTDITLYAWFTNTTEAVVLRRAEGGIYYTGVSPVPVVRATLMRERPPGQTIVIYAADIDDGSSGGVAGGQTLAIHAMAALSAADPSDDLTPEEPYVTLDTDGDYPLLLWLQNEAGTVKTSVATCMVTVLEYSGTNYWTGGGLTDAWDDGANWTAGVPADGQHVRIEDAPDVRLTGATADMASFYLAAGRTMTVEGWNSSLTATNMTIAGVMTHEVNDVASVNAQGEWVPQHRIFLEGSNITLAATGALDADYRGYRNEQGPGSGSGAGAGHTADPGVAYSRFFGPGYGGPDDPWQPGSGGGSSSSGSGGGAIRVMATGEVRIDGQIRSNGERGLPNHHHGGSGGSIYIACRTLTGDGIIEAQGGGGRHNGGHTGSGGRIALHYDPDAQAGLQIPRPPIRISAEPGDHGNDSRRNLEAIRAALGSLYMPDTLLIDADLTAKRFHYVTLHIPEWTRWEADTLTLDDCVIGLPVGHAIDVTHNLTLTNQAALYVFAAPVADVLTDVGAEIETGGDLRIASDSWIFPHADPTNGATVKMTVGGNLYVAADAGINADMRGYTRGFGPGHAGYAGSSRATPGHGGRGGIGYCGGARGNTYGDVEFPIEAGSGGAHTTASGRGGGAIRLAVAGDARLYGTLTANGGGGVANHYVGGSGGSILLESQTLRGGNSALLSADGGRGRYSAAGGGGGRIAVHYDPASQAALPEPVPPIRFSTFAHPDSTTGARYMIAPQEGTLWFPDPLLITETLDQQRFRHVRLIVPGLESSWEPESLTLDGCIITLPEGFILDVTHDLTLDNDAGLHIHAAPTNDPGQHYGAEIRVGRDLRIGTNSWIFPQAHTSNAAIVGIRVQRNVTIEPGGGIDADGRGYVGASGNNQGPGAGQSAYSGGGGYGGHGGGADGGVTYGDAALPLDPGSPAGWNTWGDGYGLGGTGGGAICLRAGGTLRIDGLVTADGWHGSYYRGSGGSGGGIFLAAQRVRGSGAIRANGGIGNVNRASGGGGRIAVWHGLSLDRIEARLAKQSDANLLQHYPYPAFSGTMDVGWYGDSTAGEPGVGSKSFYTIRGTLFRVR